MLQIKKTYTHTLMKKKTRSGTDQPYRTKQLALKRGYQN